MKENRDAAGSAAARLDADEPREWSIQQLARLTGTTSRTLRHYDDIGLLPPSSIGRNGYRHYDEQALVRLQRILLLRDLGLGLPAIAGVLDRETDEVTALGRHLMWLRGEQERLARQAAAVASTIDALRKGERIMAEKAFDGFDHTRYREEVERRWGKGASTRSDTWWRGMSAAERSDWRDRSEVLSADWRDAASRGTDPASDEGQALAARHAAWLGSIPCTPGSERGRPTREYLLGLGEMYVADERFAAHYGGASGAEFVRDALRVYAERRP
jgi:DNA-binding transcriptional MerR regulator